MKKKWKLDKLLAFSCWLLSKTKFTFCLLPFAFLILVSCNGTNESKHISSDQKVELDGLSQPSNQTVFSDVKIILPIHKSIKPIINATGLISYDPSSLNTISARFSGRIEKLYVRFNFQDVHKGQRIMDIYSPDILTEQQNLIYLISNSKDKELINSSEQKLLLLGLINSQIKQVLSTHQPINPLPIYSLYEGHIHDIGIGGNVSSSSMGGGMNATAPSKSQIENLPSSQTSELTIKEGMYVQGGQNIFAVYDMDKIWAVLNIFPKDAAQIKVGNKVLISSETNPENKIEATINYIEPITGQNASAIKVRVYLQHLKNFHVEIGTLLTAEIYSSEINGIWLPRNAVVNLGQKQVVFLKSENHFIAKNIQTGIETDSLIQIISGLNGEDKVAANAQFMVDSESFILSNDDN
jgi:membrane fusion protein, copper/silver efflux system